jgi:hypothetical protein
MNAEDNASGAADDTIGDGAAYGEEDGVDR